MVHIVDCDCVCLKDADASYDVNGRDYDPQPRYDPLNENRSPSTVSLSFTLIINFDDVLLQVAAACW